MLRAEGQIQKARLALRSFGPGDLDDLYDYQSRPDVARYLNWDARDRAQVREALEQRCREVALDRDGDWLTYAVVWGERAAPTTIAQPALRISPARTATARMP